MYGEYPNLHSSKLLTNILSSYVNKASRFNRFPLVILMISSFEQKLCGIREYTFQLILGLQRYNCKAIPIPTYKSLGFLSIPRLIREVLLKSSIYRTKIVHIQHEYGIYALPKALSIIIVMLLLRLLMYKIVVTMHTVHSPSTLFDSYLRKLRNIHSLDSFSKALLYALSIPVRFLIHILVEFLVLVLSNKIFIHAPIMSGIICLKRRKVRLVPHPTHVSVYCPSEPSVLGGLKEPGKIILLTPGFIRPGKRYDWVINALVELRNCGIRNIVYVIAGTPQSKAGYEWLNYVKAIAPPTDVIILDRYFSEQELVQLICNADIIVLPYEYASRSGSGIFHKALGLGKLIIAPRAGEFLLYKDVVLFFDLENPVKSLFRSLHEVLKDPGKFTPHPSSLRYYRITSLESVCMIHVLNYLELILD